MNQVYPDNDPDPNSVAWMPPAPQTISMPPVPNLIFSAPAPAYINMDIPQGPAPIPGSAPDQVPYTAYNPGYLQGHPGPEGPPGPPGAPWPPGYSPEPPGAPGASGSHQSVNFIFADRPAPAHDLFAPIPSAPPGSSVCAPTYSSYYPAPTAPPGGEYTNPPNYTPYLPPVWTTAPAPAEQQLYRDGYGGFATSMANNSDRQTFDTKTYHV